MKPNFIVVGQAKCGTTSLCDLLQGHPEIFFSKPKEPRYFSNMDNYGDPLALEEYLSLFSNVNNEAVVGEGSTNYTHPDFVEATSKRIYEYIPACKIIYMVRHPLRRIESDWRMRVREGWAEEDINVAVKSNLSLISHSLYWRNFSPYTRYFPEEHRLVIFLEDFVINPRAELIKCLSFLGVDDQVLLEEPARKRNAATDFYTESSIIKKISTIRALNRIKKLTPEKLKLLAKRLFRVEYRYNLTWHPEIKREITAEIKPDANKFLESCGKQKDFWSFTE